MAKPGGFIRFFVNAGPLMARLVFETLSREICTEHVRR
jgi:hypothetical protein